MKYVKKPIVIEAVQWNGENTQELIRFLGGKNTEKSSTKFIQITGNNFEYYLGGYKENLIIKTLEGNMQASVGDYIIKGIKGEYYPFKPDIFEQSYDKWEEPVFKDVCNTIFQTSGTYDSGSFVNPTTTESKQVVESEKADHIYTNNLDNLGIIGNTYPKLFEVLIRLRPTINDLLTNHGLFINLDYVLSNALDHKFRPHHISYKREGIVHTEISINYDGIKGAQSIVIRNEQDIEINFPEWIVEEKFKTFGENLMGITFNPSGNQMVHEIKTKFAEIADLINKHYEERTDYQFEALIIFQNCLQHLLDAQMNCVKLVTYKQK